MMSNLYLRAVVQLCWLSDAVRHQADVPVCDLRIDTRNNTAQTHQIWKKHFTSAHTR